MHNDDTSDSGKTRSEDSYEETCLLVGESVCGMVQSATLEIDS